MQLEALANLIMNLHVIDRHGEKVEALWPGRHMQDREDSEKLQFTTMRFVSN